MSREGPVPARYVAGALLAALVLAVYWPAGSLPFVIYDDGILVSENPALTGGFSIEWLRWAFTTGIDAGRVPVTWLSRLLDVSLFGMDAGKHHLVNVAFHLANVLLLFHLFRRMTGALWKSALVAALFAAHPLHVESVAWVAERKDVLFAFFWFLSMLAYVRYAERPGGVRYGGALLLFALSLMSKPMAVTVPFVLLMLDWWPLGRFRPGPRAEADGAEAGHGGGSLTLTAAPLRRLLIEKVPFLALSAWAGAVTWADHAAGGALVPLEAIPLWARVGNGVLSYGTYLWKTAIPCGLSVFYPHLGTALPWGKVFLSALLLVAVTVAALRRLRRRPWFAFGWFWFLGTLVPVIGLAQSGSPAMADRYVYLPLVGVFVLIAWGGDAISGRLAAPKPAVAAAVLASLLSLAAVSRVQLSYWKDSATLFRHALAVDADNWLARHSLALLALKEGNNDEAALHLREGLRIWPDLPAGHETLAGILSDRGELEESAFHYREAIRRSPFSPELHNNLGAILARRGLFAEAAEQFREALRLRPGYEGARRNLGRALLDAAKGKEGGGG